MRRNVPIEIRIKTVITVPEDWDDDMIRFYACENHCISNEISALASRDPEGICSLCGDAETLVLKPEEYPDLMRRYAEDPLFKS